MTRLRELQRAKKLTQQELADIAEVSKRTIQNWEDGTSNIKLEKAKKLADYFGVSVGYLLGYDDNDFEKQIRIDTLNDIINHLHKTHISLFKTTNETAFWAGFETAELIVQTQKMILEFEESADGK